MDGADGDGGATEDEEARSSCLAAATLVGLDADAEQSVDGIGGALGRKATGGGVACKGDEGCFSHGITHNSRRLADANF